MTRAVYKYPVAFTDDFVLSLPAGAELLTVHEQRASVYVWALVDPTATVFEDRRFRLVGTGYLFDEPDVAYIGTVHLGGGTLVFHLFEVVG